MRRGLSIHFICLCMQIFKKKIPEAFLLSLTRIYLSAVITYSLMHNTLCWLHGGGCSEHEDGAGGENI